MFSFKKEFRSKFSLFIYLKHVYLIQNMSAYLSERLIFLTSQEMLIFAALVFGFILLSSYIALKTTIKRLNHFAYD